MEHRVGLAIVCLHISAALYLICGVLAFPLFMALDQSGLWPIFAGLTLVLCLALIVGIEVVAHGLRRRKFWAWVVGLAIFGMYVPSLFLPLGALGLWGLLDRRSREEFGVHG